jgi:hypothetical protein
VGRSCQGWSWSWSSWGAEFLCGAIALQCRLRSEGPHLYALGCAPPLLQSAHTTPLMWQIVSPSSPLLASRVAK